MDIECGFGGVGASGYGRVGGYESFKQFSNPKQITIKQPLMFFPYNQICPPYTPFKQNLLNTLLNLTCFKQNAIIKKIYYLFVLFVIWLFFRSKRLQGLRQSLLTYLLS